MKKSFIIVIIITSAVTLVSGYTVLTSRKTPPSVTFAKTDKQRGLVPSFPEIPAYPGSTIVNSYVKSEGDRLGYEGNWITIDPVFNVMNWFLQQLLTDGWQLIRPPNVPRHKRVTGESAAFEKGNLILNLEIEKEGRAETEIHMEFPLQKP